MKPTDIYILIHPVTGEIYYVGKSEVSDDRYKYHRNNIRWAITYGCWGDHRVNYGVNLALEFGKYPTMAIVETVRDVHSQEAEADWALYFLNRGNRLTNVAGIRKGQSLDPQKWARWKLPFTVIGKYTRYTVEEMKGFIEETKQFAEPFISQQNAVVTECMGIRINKMQKSLTKVENGIVRCNITL